MPDGTAIIMYALFAVSLGILVYGYWRKWAMYRRGKEAPKLDHVGLRLKRLFSHAILQTKILRKRYAGPMHALIFYGFVVLFIGTLLVALDYDVTQPLLGWQFLKGGFYLFFELALDFAGILLILGLLMAVKRRVIDRPEALKSTWQDAAILSTLLIVSITGYIMEALRLAIRDPAWANYSFVAATIRPFLPAWDTATLLALYQSLWWTHAALVFLFIAAIPYTKLHHIFTSPANIFFAPLEDPKLNPKGKLPTPFNLKQIMESGSFDITMGAKRLEDFSWRDLLTVDACTECGRCQEQCPAYAAGRPLSPMKLVLDLRNELRRKGPAAKQAKPVEASTTNELVDSVIAQETLWSCVTCRACMEACPVDITHVPLIVDMRRGLVADMKIDKQKTDLLNNLTNTGNAYGLPASERAKWAEGLDVPIVGQTQGDLEVLYWVGCSGSYDPRNQNVSRSVVKVLKAAGVKFAILGPNERCTGDPARRLGEEGRFQELTLANVEAIQASGAKTVIAQCPHCFNTIQNEYREFGLDLKVEHHSQFIDRLIQSGRLAPSKATTESFTYHDPCYLGRYNDEYEAPRRMLKVINGVELKEMGRNCKNSFCCGAGGSNMWFEVKEETTRISNLRMKEALSTGAKNVATACPFCLTMFEDASRVMAGDSAPRVRDVAEILAESLDEPASPPSS
jgi:Fe-S oxidoreductase/nitrate reductase gamma subunit